MVPSEILFLKKQLYKKEKRLLGQRKDQRLSGQRKDQRLSRQRKDQNVIQKGLREDGNGKRKGRRETLYVGEKERKTRLGM